MDIIKQVKNIFQFYISTIKAANVKPTKTIKFEFQFYISTIKAFYDSGYLATVV